MDQKSESINTNAAFDPPTTPTAQDRLTFLAAKLKSTVKSALIGGENSSVSDESVQEDIFEDAAFNPQQVLEASPLERGSRRDKLQRSLHGLAATVKNPKRSLRAKYARIVAGNVGGHAQAYDQKYDEELVEAHDTLNRANLRVRTHETIGSVHDGHGSIKCDLEDAGDANIAEIQAQHEVNTAAARVRRVEAQRESLEDAWILGRHVKRVRSAKPMQELPELVTAVSQRSSDATSWSKRRLRQALWQTRGFTSYQIDDFDDLPFDLQELQLTIERLVIVSTPWQNFLVEVRNVYLWKDPARTLKYMTAFWTMWYFQHIMTATLAWVVFATILNRTNPTQIDTIRKKVARAKSDQAKAQAWGELIQRHGKHDWIEPLLDEIGPLLQLELTDMSNLLERIQNFYGWERPRKTMATLFFFMTCLLLCIVTNMEFCVQLVQGAAGCFFFFTLPLSARYPRYRRLFNPIYWVFWDIPNRAEVAITHLQEKAILRDAARLQSRKGESSVGKGLDGPHPEDDRLQWSSSSESEAQASTESRREHDDDVADLRSIQDNDSVTFRAINTETHDHGRLKVLRQGFWYYDRKTKSFYQYSHLLEIRKVEISKANDTNASRTAKIANRIEESLSLQFLPSGIEFIFDSPASDIVSSTSSRGDSEMILGDDERLALTVSQSDRDKIFSLIIGWSGLKWQPQFSLNRRHQLSVDAHNPARRAKGNEKFDKAVKGFVIE